jgi:hypothetical protein
MNSYSQLQLADVNEVYRAWQIPEAESVIIEDNSTSRLAVAAVALGLLFGVALATAAANLSVPASPAPEHEDSSNASALRAPHKSALKIHRAPVPLPDSRASRPAQSNTVPFFMEGDANVAEFDSSSGIIQTDAGKTFLIGIPADARNAAPWQDYHRNVHYRCDQSGNCTISGAGLVVPNAKLT